MQVLITFDRFEQLYLADGRCMVSTMGTQHRPSVMPLGGLYSWTLVILMRYDRFTMRLPCDLSCKSWFFSYKMLYLGMVYVLIAISSIVIGLALLLTEGNAKYLLAGYNSMSVEEREKIEIKGLVSYFRNFHLFLGSSFLIISLLLIFYVGETAGTVFVCSYPVLAEIYFVISAAKYRKK